MKKYISLFLSSLAIIVSVITLCVSKPSTSELGIDYLGIIVGILALLVTVLIGWQIFSLFDIEKTRKNIIEQRQTMLKDIYNDQGNICEEIFYSTLSKAPESILNYNSILHISFTGLKFYSKAQNRERCIYLLNLTISTNTPEYFRLNEKAQEYFKEQLKKLFVSQMIDEDLYFKAEKKITSFKTV